MWLMRSLKCPSPPNTNIQTFVFYLLVTVGLHHISDVDDRSLNVENLDHLDVKHPHHHGVGIQQAANGCHAYGPIEQSAAYKQTATSQVLFLLEAHSDETFVLISLPVIDLRKLFNLTVDPENPTYGDHTLNTCRGGRKTEACESSETPCVCVCVCVYRRRSYYVTVS